MHVFHDLKDLNKLLSEQLSRKKSIGLVPTMGALHDGHLALVQHASAQNDLVVVSIFVNPTQFNNPQDLSKYPREPEKDIQKLESHGFCDVVYLPEVRDIYPNGEKTEDIDLNGTDNGMEGSYRPGHFDGVATVVKRFFEIVQPTRAYFGEKDFQQLAVIKQMTKSLGLQVEIFGVPTHRSKKGLALSSRNQLLSEEDLEKALLIIQSLRWIKANARSFSASELKAKIQEDFRKSDLKLEYVEITDSKNLKPIEGFLVNDDARAFIAAQVSGVRLIDNLSLF